MDRLTIPDVRVDEHTTRRAMIDGEAVREHAMDFYWRLKAYEDMGLTPEEIKSMKDEHFSGLEMAKLHSALMELKKYQEADKDGRLVVLPCKVGDTLYYCNGKKRIIDFEVTGFSVDDTGAWLIHAEHHENEKSTSYRYSLDTDKIGKTLFFTRGEAKRALEAKQNG